MCKNGECFHVVIAGFNKSLYNAIKNKNHRALNLHLMLRKSKTPIYSFRVKVDNGEDKSELDIAKYATSHCIKSVPSGDALRKTFYFKFFVLFLIKQQDLVMVNKQKIVKNWTSWLFKICPRKNAPPMTTPTSKHWRNRLLDTSTLCSMIKLSDNTLYEYAYDDIKRKIRDNMQILLKDNSRVQFTNTNIGHFLDTGSTHDGTVEYQKGTASKKNSIQNKPLTLKQIKDIEDTIGRVAQKYATELTKITPAPRVSLEDYDASIDRVLAKINIDNRIDKSIDRVIHFARKTFRDNPAATAPPPEALQGAIVNAVSENILKTRLAPAIERVKKSNNNTNSLTLTQSDQIKKIVKKEIKKTMPPIKNQELKKYIVANFNANVMPVVENIVDKNTDKTVKKRATLTFTSELYNDRTSAFANARYADEVKEEGEDEFDRRARELEKKPNTFRKLFMDQYANIPVSSSSVYYNSNVPSTYTCNDCGKQVEFGDLNHATRHYEENKPKRTVFDPQDLVVDDLDDDEDDDEDDQDDYDDDDEDSILNDEGCVVCGEDSSEKVPVVYCDYEFNNQVCDAGYHLTCLDPPLTSVPEGLWYCPDHAGLARGSGTNSNDNNVMSSNWEFICC